MDSSENYRSSNLSFAGTNRHINARLDYRNQDSPDSPVTESLNYHLDTQMVVSKDPESKTDNDANVDILSNRGNVIIELKGNAKDTEMVVKNRGRIMARGYPGQTLNFNVGEYRTTQLSIAPTSESSIVSYDTEPVNVTLYPENVFRKTWRVDQMTLVLGRLIDLDGKPVEYQRIKGLKNFATTDAQGNFQMELIGNEMPYIEGSKNRCTVALPNIDTGEAFQYVGNLVCS